MKYVYRTVNGILGILVIVCAIYTKFIEVMISTGESLEKFFETLFKNQNNGVALSEQFSIHRIYNLFNGRDELSYLVEKGEDKPFLWPKELDPINTRIIIFLAAFAVMILIALFIIIWSCCSNKRIPMLVSGIAGIVADIVMITAFRSAADDIYTGKADLTGYIVNSLMKGGLLSGLVEKLADGAFDIVLSLCGLQNALLFIFIGVALWTVCFYLVDIGDPQAKAEKEALKAAKAEKKAAKASKKAIKKEGKA